MLLPVVLVGSCLPWGDSREAWDVDRPAGIQLEVQNQHFNEVVVYAMPDGVRQRIGEVRGMDSATFDIAPSLIGGTGGLRLLISPIGTREAYLSEVMNPVEGDTVVMVVAARLQHSRWYIR